MSLDTAIQSGAGTGQPTRPIFRLRLGTMARCERWGGRLSHSTQLPATVNWLGQPEALPPERDHAARIRETHLPREAVATRSAKGAC